MLFLSILTGVLTGVQDCEHILLIDFNDLMAKAFKWTYKGRVLKA